MSEENPDYAPDDGAETTAAKPPAPTLDDLELQPFTPERFVAAQAAGLKFPIARDAWPQDGTLYAGELMDAVLVLWICTIPVASDKPGDWTVKRALRKPDQAMEAALTWGAEKGISVAQSPAFWKAIELYEGILVDVTNSYTEPKNANNGGAPSPKD
jgi:hypothetical protein